MDGAHRRIGHDDAGIAALGRRGHFAYESGDHGDTWLALDLLTADPRRLRAVARRLAAALRPFAPAVVCGPLTGGAFAGLLVAEELGAGFVPAERRPVPDLPVCYGLPSALRPVVAGTRVAIVDDAVNAGSATLATHAAVAVEGGETVVVGALVARTPGAAELLTGHGLQLVALAGLPFALWPASCCPLCATGVPFETPG